MSTPAQNTMNVNTPASIAAFQAKSAADKVLSYMWYIHVLVSVNTESRLRTKISRVLEHPVSPNDSSTESTDSTASFNHHHHQPSLNLIDHLVLWLFSHTILTRLVDVPPVYAQANGYTCILADVPVDLREEFARRLYTLLFSQHIVEWPHGIDVPEPCIPAAEPVVGPATVDDVSVKLEDTTPLSSGQQEDQDGDKKSFGGAGLDGVMESKGEEGSKSPASSFRPAASIWLQTPGLSSWDNDEDIAHMERATYFGTVSSPLPMDYFADWEWSRNGSGPHRGSIDEQSVSGVQLKAPFPSPLQQQQQQQQQQHISFDRIVQTVPCESNRIKPQCSHAHQQGRGTSPVMYGDDIGNHSCEVTGWSSNRHNGTGFPRFCRSGRVDIGHAASKQPGISDEQQALGLRWKRDSPVTGAYPIHANNPRLGYIANFLRSAE